MNDSATGGDDSLDDGAGRDILDGHAEDMSATTTGGKDVLDGGTGTDLL